MSFVDPSKYRGLYMNAFHAAISRELQTYRTHLADMEMKLLKSGHSLPLTAFQTEFSKVCWWWRRYDNMTGPLGARMCVRVGGEGGDGGGEWSGGTSWHTNSQHYLR